MASNAAPRSGDSYLSFDGYDDYIEIPNQHCYSVDYAWEFTFAAWIRADVADFPTAELDRDYFVHWIGKGEGRGDRGAQEWVARMYNASTRRPQLTSFYVFNPEGELGVGSYVNGPVELRAWRLIVGMVDAARTYLYLNGEFIQCDTYSGPATGGCPIMTDRSGMQVVIHPLHGTAPLRIGTQDKRSFFLGGIAKVRICNRKLSDEEIQALYFDDLTPRDQLAAEFMLNEGGGDIAVDTARGNHGTIYGAHWAVQS